MADFPDWIQVENSVLYHSTGEEVALWGINYYPPFGAEYEVLRHLGVDHKKAMDEDFQHFPKMKIEVIRMHFWDGEITDKEGNLLQNEHLDLLDYLIKKAKDHGIYMFLTPITGYRSKRTKGFTADYSKLAIIFNPEAIKAQVNYLKQLVHHVNPYTGLAYGDDPVVCAYEVFNEPIYWPYTRPPQDWQAEGKVLAKQWSEWLKRKGEEVEELKTEDGHKLPDYKAPDNLPTTRETKTNKLFREFMYKDTLANYINTTVASIKEAGAKQPVFYSAFSGATIAREVAEIKESLEESICDGVTYSWYPGRWTARVPRTHDMLSDLDADNLLWKSRKAKTVYEFDTIGSPYTYVYPAFARFWKEMGTQIACMFAYNPKEEAHLNVTWPQHYLNFLYTPGKAVSFAIASEVYHRCERDKALNLPLEEQRWDCFSLSHTSDLSVMKTENVLMHTNNYFGNVPPSLRYLMGVGSSRFIEYDGTGIYTADVTANKVTLEINPDAIPVGDPWTPAYGIYVFQDNLAPAPRITEFEDLKKRAVVTELRNSLREILIKLPWKDCKVTKVDNSKTTPIQHEKYRDWYRFKVTPGRYEIKKTS